MSTAADGVQCEKAIARKVLLGGCTSSLTSDTYSQDEPRRLKTVRMGTIVASRPVQAEGTKTPVGATAGTVIGSRGSIVTAVIGAVAGGLPAIAADSGLTETQGVEIIVRENDSSPRVYVQ